MEHKKVAHFLYMPLTGLGLYGGHRGKRWLRNRIKIFKHSVLRSLRAQTDKNFILWVSVRHEDKRDPIIQEFQEFLAKEKFPVVFTYSGVCFWDDKHPDDVAYNRLIDSVHGSLGELINVMGEADTILMTIQPSDDCYHRNMVKDVQDFFALNPDVQCFGYQYGYIMDYLTGRVKEWNPKTTPPFYTIKFPRVVFTNPMEHVKYTGPYKSHEYVKDYLKAHYDTEKRGFLVGTHGENISTVFNHPFAGKEFYPGLNEPETKNWVLGQFGLSDVPLLKIKTSLRKAFMRKLPVGWQRKFRYLLGERFYAKIYDFLRS